MDYIDLEASEELRPLGSSFDGGRGTFILYSLLKYVAAIVSASLLYPLAEFLFDRWEVKESKIDGKSLTFDGTIFQAYAIYVTGVFFILAVTIVLRRFSNLFEGLLGAYAKTVLTAVNTGLGAIFLDSRLQKWKARHTLLLDRTGRSRLKKNLLFVAGLNTATWLLGILTLGLSYPLIYSIRAAYYTEVTDISGENLAFFGKVKDAYRGWLSSVFFIILTLGVYLIVLEYSLDRWRIRNTHFEKVI